MFYCMFYFTCDRSFSTFVTARAANTNSSIHHNRHRHHFWEKCSPAQVLNVLHVLLHRCSGAIDQGLITTEINYTVQSKKSPQRFSDIFPTNRWELLVQILHAYYTFLSMLDNYFFLFNYLQLWRSYAILHATTQRVRFGRWWTFWAYWSELDGRA